MNIPRRISRSATCTPEKGKMKSKITVNNPTGVLTTVQSQLTYSMKCVWKYRPSGWRCFPIPCLTVGGPEPGQAGKRCIFPFTHDGVTYNGCPVDPYVPTERWCSTKVDSEGKHVSGENEFGYCDAKNCPEHTT